MQSKCVSDLIDQRIDSLIAKIMNKVVKVDGPEHSTSKTMVNDILRLRKGSRGQQREWKVTSDSKYAAMNKSNK